ncbi:MAG: MoaD/ThiS family protein [Desulfobacterales bacterium]|nr:MoaD/ThiS family protein [Desulfobacterales bacterium]
MLVSVKFYGAQQKLTCTQQLEVPISEGECVEDIYANIRDRYPDLPLNKQDITISVNNKTAGMNQVLNADDKVSFLPHIGGG